MNMHGNKLDCVVFHDELHVVVGVFFGFIFYVKGLVNGVIQNFHEAFSSCLVIFWTALVS